MIYKYQSLGDVDLTELIEALKATKNRKATEEDVINTKF